VMRLRLSVSSFDAIGKGIRENVQIMIGEKFDQCECRGAAV